MTTVLNYGADNCFLFTPPIPGKCLKGSVETGQELNVILNGGCPSKFEARISNLETRRQITKFKNRAYLRIWKLFRNSIFGFLIRRYAATNIFITWKIHTYENLLSIRSGRGRAIVASMDAALG